MFSSSLEAPPPPEALPQDPRKRQRVLVWVTAFSVLGLAWLIKITGEVGSGRSETIDRVLLRRVNLLSQSSEGDWMTPAAKFISLIGNWQFVAPLGALVLFFAWRKRLPWRSFLLYLVSVAGSSALTLAFKYGVNRPRPEIVPPLEKAPFASFPSGHTVFALVVYGFLAHLILSHVDRPSRWLMGLLYGLAVLIAGMVGLTRVYLATHYPTDVVAGFLIGAPLLLTVIALDNHFAPSRDIPTDPPAHAIK
ncbi:MAG: phosphatase PAP2 family protein [Cytophagales bacterium]|nr:phosphatase PAP2 family protein [Armatimonadota bacterium]